MPRPTARLCGRATGPSSGRHGRPRPAQRSFPASRAGFRAGIRALAGVRAGLSVSPPVRSPACSRGARLSGAPRVAGAGPRRRARCRLPRGPFAALDREALARETLHGPQRGAAHPQHREGNACDCSLLCRVASRTPGRTAPTNSRVLPRDLRPVPLPRKVCDGAGPCFVAVDCWRLPSVGSIVSILPGHISAELVLDQCQPPSARSISIRQWSLSPHFRAIVNKGGDVFGSGVRRSVSLTHIS